LKRVAGCPAATIQIGHASGAPLEIVIHKLHLVLLAVTSNSARVLRIGSAIWHARELIDQEAPKVIHNHWIAIESGSH